jgi:hypothetical protein
MWTAIWVLVAELGIIAFLAVRRAHLHWWQKTFAVTAASGRRDVRRRGQDARTLTVRSPRR